MKIKIKKMDFSAANGTAEVTLSVYNGSIQDTDQECTVEVVGLEVVIEKTVNALLLKAVTEVNATE